MVGGLPRWRKIGPLYGEYIQLMFDLMVMAFQTDSTRVATMCLAHDGSNRSFSDIGISERHHDLSHHQKKKDRVKKVAQIDLWYAKQFGKFLRKFEAVKDVDGQSLLHNSMIMYDGGNADANRHTHTNLFLSMADRMGVKKVERFGDSSGRLTDVWGGILSLLHPLNSRPKLL